MNTAYLNTRITLLGARLWPLARLDALVDAEADQADFALLQRRAGLGPLAEQLWQELLDDALVLVRPLAGTARRFFFAWLRKAEIDNLKTLLRGKLGGLPEADVRANLIDLRGFSRLPVAALLETENPAEMLRLLEHATPYAETARQARLVYEKKHELFTLEATLDYAYWSTVLKQARQIEKAERGPLLHLFGYVLERYNFIWMLRYRFTYGLSPTETHYLLVTGLHDNLTGVSISSLLTRASLEDTLTALPPQMRAYLSGARTLLDIEQRVEERVREEARQVLKHSRQALARALAYLLLRECENRRISAVIKGRRMGLDSALIRAGADLPGFGT